MIHSTLATRPCLPSQRCRSTAVRIWTYNPTQHCWASQQCHPPRSAVGAAIGYALNQWDALVVYTTQGFLNIDNNAAERARRRVAVGRKNWLFAGNDTFGVYAARFYSLIASAERAGIDPQAYLTSILADLPVTTAAELDQLLPDVWASRQKSSSSSAAATSST